MRPLSGLGGMASEGSELSDRYRLKGGRIYNRSCEVNIVEHCNLRCRGCAHLSPAFPKHFVDVSAFSADLTTLAQSYHVKVLRLLGGEPLMHPNLLDIMTAARESQVADMIEVTTNGLLLPRVDPRFWQQADLVRISLYPGRSLKQHQLDKCVDLARENNVSLRYRRYEAFQESYSEPGTDDPELVKRIYATCNHVHRWRCHTVANGWFFKCSQSYTIPTGMSLGPQAAHQAGIQIAGGPEFRDRLLSYLTSPEPLSSCRNCLGSAGKYFEHQQLRRGEFRSVQCRPTEDLVHPRLVGTTRLALSRAESFVPRAVMEPQALRSYPAFVGLLRKVQGFNSHRFRG
jgi:organic radical activating enzyme